MQVYAAETSIIDYMYNRIGIAPSAKAALILQEGGDAESREEDGEPQVTDL